MLPTLPEVFDGTHSFLKCNSRLLHLLQESVSAEILTHSSRNLCKLILAVALRGYSPQSLTSVQFSMCAVQHISNKSDQSWLDGSEQWTLQQRLFRTLEHPSEMWHLQALVGSSVPPPRWGKQPEQRKCTVVISHWKFLFKETVTAFFGNMAQSCN